jgi:uncharacterized protein
MTSLETKPKVRLELPDIARKLKSLTLPDVDAVVGIATGGVAFASIVAFWLEKPLHVIHLNYRDENNKPRHAKPTLLRPFDIDSTTFKGIHPLANGEPTEDSSRHVLLVDDVSVSGATLEAARNLLAHFQTTTLVIKGKADFVLYPDVPSCILLPWRD